MSIPDFQSFFRPLLDLASDGLEHSISEARGALATSMNISATDLEERLPSGTQRTFDNRVAWAKTYFVQARILEPTRRGHFQITPRGMELLGKRHDRIDIRILRQYPEFAAFHAGNQSEDSAEQPSLQTNRTPEETFHSTHQDMQRSLAADLLQRIKSNSPQFFERLVVDLMVGMGYGGSKAEAGKAIGRSGDEGIDGIINEDKLGLDLIYLQAKRWEGSVGRPEIQKFVGALHGKKARKGVFITTGKFSNEAEDYASHIDPKVVLIDGRRLVSLMIDFNIGTQTVATLEQKQVDLDFFAEE